MLLFKITETDSTATNLKELCILLAYFSEISSLGHLNNKDYLKNKISSIINSDVNHRIKSITRYNLTDSTQRKWLVGPGSDSRLGDVEKNGVAYLKLE